MIIKEYVNAQEFLNDYESVLIKQESVSQLILYNAYSNMNAVASGTCMFGVVMENEALLLFCNVAPYNLIIFVPNTINDKEKIHIAAQKLADYFSENHIPLAGINARYSICQSFIEQYKQHVSCIFHEKLGMDIMEIREINDIKPVDGIQRLARPDDAKLVADWMIEFQIDALDSEMDYEAALKKAELYINEDNIYFYEDVEQNIVTMAIAARKLAHGIAISYIYTPQEYRGKGYAAANVYYLSKKMLEQGYEFCTLFVDKKNPISNRAYEKVGYSILEDNYEYIVILQE